MPCSCGKASLGGQSTADPGGFVIEQPPMREPGIMERAVDEISNAFVSTYDAFGRPSAAVLAGAALGVGTIVWLVFCGKKKGAQ